MKGAFITATGTGVGKTWLASALATACMQQGKRVAAITRARVRQRVASERARLVSR
ncbi:MAG: ATP-binding protein [Deltaproteobacteria bacterium]|nr:ATP-binding protein [Deltaproteobacteria bacterium]